MSRLGKRECLLALAICAITGSIVAYKIFALDFAMAVVSPDHGYFIRLVMNVRGNGRDCDVRFALPIQSERQSILHEKQIAERFSHTISPGRVGKWSAKKLSGSGAIVYSCLAQTEAKEYPMPVGQDIPTTYTLKLQDELVPAERIQSDDPDIRAKALELAPAGVDLKTAVEAIYNYCHREIRYVETSGPTDAITALRLREASCNGKNRLMVALLRSRGIPARMVNGLILKRSSKRTTHAWTEAWVAGTWTPLCPTNGHFAKIPENYLELAKGDVAIISHSPHIGFDWKFTIRRQLKTREEAVLSNADDPLNPLHYWMELKDYRVSLSLVMVILMVPIGATIVAFSRNAIGIVPFGTFMPTLIAVAFRDTGFFLGFGMFLAVLVIGTLCNFGLIQLRLLHIPRLVIIITIVVMSILGISIALIKAGIGSGAAVSLFPMAIISLTSERFTMSLIQDGWKDASRRMIETLIVAAACFAVMNWGRLQFLIVAYPELLLANIAANLALGSWTGMRLTELRRFRILRPEARA